MFDNSIFARSTDNDKTLTEDEEKGLISRLVDDDDDVGMFDFRGFKVMRSDHAIVMLDKDMTATLGGFWGLPSDDIPGIHRWLTRKVRLHSNGEQARKTELPPEDEQ